MSDSNTQQKVVLGVLAAALGAMLIGYLFKRHSRSQGLIQQNKSSKKKSESVATSKSSGKEEELDENYAKAQELKEQGNQAFKVGKFEEAIEFYTEGLKLAKTDQHVLYSNRSAAFAARNAFDKALEDAQKCIEVNPTWSKGYFRVGKALLGMFEFDKAFFNFLKGLKLDPKSDELKKLLEQTRGELGPGEMDTRLVVDNNMIKQFFKITMEEICKSKLDAEFDLIKEIIKDAIKSKTTATLLENPYIKPLYEKDAKSTLRVLTQTLLEEDKGDDALLYAENAYNMDSNDPTILQLLASAKLRSPPNHPGALGSELIEPMDLIRKAIDIDPTDPTIAHTFASIILRYSSLFQPQQNPYQTVPQPVPIDIKPVLKQLRTALANPNANALLISDSGIRLWFKLFEDPEIQKMLMEEENNSMQNGISPMEAYISGLKNGAFNRLCMEPFFMEALSKIVFNNPALEKVLSPFRTAFASVEGEDEETFSIVSPLIYAMSLQCYRNNYAWATTPDDDRLLKRHRQSAVAMLKEIPSEELSSSIISNPKLLRHLSIVSLYEPLIDVDDEVGSKLHEALTKVDLSKFHPWASSVIKKTLMDPHHESVIAQNLQSLTLTPIPKNAVMDYTNQHIGTYWDSAGMAGGRMTKISIKQELDWVFPHYKSIGFDSQKKTRVLIAGCSSGVEVMQADTIYSNIDIIGIDSSTTNVSYAIRQNEELGVKAKFFVADIPQIERTHFNNELFDMIVVHGALNHFTDPLKPWEKLANLLRPGGLMRVSVFSKNFLDFVSKCRRFLSDKFSPPIFENSVPTLSSKFGKNANATVLPRVLRSATVDEIRKARSLMLDSGDPNAMGQQQTGGVDEELQEEMLMIPSFYSLNEFTDLIFHPQIVAFTFTTIGSCLDRLGLKLVGFEFPGIMQETILSYRVEYPDDPNFLNCEYLEKFEEKNPYAFKNFAQSIIFACEKPVSK